MDFEQKRPQEEGIYKDPALGSLLIYFSPVYFSLLFESWEKLPMKLSFVPCALSSLYRGWGQPQKLFYFPKL